MNVRNVLTRLTAPALLALAGLALAPAAHATDIGISIGFSQPGAYGRVDIGQYAQPVLVAPQPVVIGTRVYREPVYLWVPAAQRRDWRRYCGSYNACGAPVYFVEDRWYRSHVVPRKHNGPRGHAYGHDRGHGPHGAGAGPHRHDDRRDHRRDDRRGGPGPR
jgi:hypothetical protein